MSYNSHTLDQNVVKRKAYVFRDFWLRTADKNNIPKFTQHNYKCQRKYSYELR